MKTLEGNVIGKGLKVGIVAARFNEFIVNKLIGGAEDALVRHGVDTKDVELAYVPGAFEIPIVAQKMAASSSVSHCYDRNTAPDWPYNLYTMVHGHSREECERIVEELGRECKVSEHTMLYSQKEWKKTSMRYFMEK